MSGENLTRKILASHVVGGRLELGSEVGLRVDQVLLQDATSPTACMQFEQLDIDRVRVPLVIQYIDHQLVQLDFKNPDDHRFLKDVAARYGIHYSRPGNGICHYVHAERFAQPGLFLVGTDSHSTSAGALGMLAVGAGGLDVAVVMGGEPFVVEVPQVVGVELTGRLGSWVQAKDVVLELLRRRTVRGGVGRIFEFFGDGVVGLDVPSRMTICNMIAEMGATTAVFPSDGRTREWLEEQDRGEQWLELGADPGAVYDESELIELDRLEPLIAMPSSPGNVVPVREVAGVPVAQVCVGSSVNSGFMDLAIVAAVLDRHSLHENVVLTVTPGSRQILDTLAQTGLYRQLVRAGARMLEPACGPCVGMGQAPPSGAVSVRTFNRNFPGRSGTVDDQVYLCSPATAVATAVNGVITDPRDLGEEPQLTPARAHPEVVDRQIIVPLPPAAAARVQITRGPNIQPLPPQIPLPVFLTGRIATIVGDDVSTGDMAPDGAEVMSLRSNTPAIAEYTFRRLDPEFVSRVRDWGGGFIVGGWNYGQGSSRENAVLSPKYLGIRAVIAKSFARIHRRNLIAQGIVPLLLPDEQGYDPFVLGQTCTLPLIHRELAEDSPTITAHITETDQTMALGAPFSPRERRLLIAGGLLAHTRETSKVKQEAGRG